MRAFGFSTGALAYSDFRRGLAMLLGRDIRAVELSALRRHELAPLVAALDDIDLSQFNYISFHAPSDTSPEDVEQVLDLLERVAERDWPVIVHPDSMHKPSVWRRLGRSLCIENNDKRKPVGRTAAELAAFFDECPEASFCFDIGHARQVDSTMTEAYLMLKAFGPILRQIHLSEVNTRSKHDPLSHGSILAFREVAHLIPESVPVILETPVSEPQIESEVERALSALPLCPEPLFTR